METVARPADIRVPSEAGSAPILRVEGLKKVYSSRRRGPVVAVDGVSFDVAPRQIVGLLGPNGAGKTTTIKSICTLLKPTAGSVWVDGVDALARPRKAVAKVAAVLEGNRNIYWRLTAFENLELFAGLHGISAKAARPEIEELLARFRLEDKAKSEARTLSRGMQQKLAVACAFIRHTPILLLDEPTLGLDVETSYELREQLKQMAAEQGKTILLSSHDMDVVQDLCERVIIISEGKIVTDDSVGALLEVFKARAYRFEIAGSLEAVEVERLKQRFEVSEVAHDGAHTVLDVQFASGADIYSLMDELRSTGSQIEAIDRKDPDLEQIFLEIIRARGGNR